ncbi:hypothetical protein TBR22_A23920 [Luteitalea sp. TBR-22]|uniref:hypothetical protein n=1 Tax=Luteitalea sp. TBR-22 TaxID=2802971 RepID=UPI001AF27B5C|nr:hypothetical protein [Luteitalea sp. TBR-22]BCS33165.1 hypothetical protein TBR22_A23920 [Luteitalea sp. TBR-22]
MPRSHALLAGLFDYAGLFPPAGQPLEEALASYARYRASRDGWMLGRFVVPASQLEAVSAAALRYLPTGDASVSWRFSALGGPDPQADVAHVSAFNGRHADALAGAAIVDTFEVKVTSVEDVRAARAWASRGFEVYCEVPLGGDTERLLDAVAHAGLHAKVRTGGTTIGSVPSADLVAEFLCGCVARGVVSKATAGLHHAVSGMHASWPGGEHGPMIGFLNLVLAAGIAEGAGRAAAQSPEVCATVSHLLGVSSAPSWLGHSVVEWRGDHGAVIEGPLDQFAVAGRALVRSIGTCSFEEPVTEARGIGLLQ